MVYHVDLLSAKNKRILYNYGLTIRYLRIGICSAGYKIPSSFYGTMEFYINKKKPFNYFIGT